MSRHRKDKHSPMSSAVPTLNPLPKSMSMSKRRSKSWFVWSDELECWRIQPALPKSMPTEFQRRRRAVFSCRIRLVPPSCHRDTEPSVCAPRAYSPSTLLLPLRPLLLLQQQNYYRPINQHAPRPTTCSRMMRTPSKSCKHSTTATTAPTPQRQPDFFFVIVAIDTLPLRCCYCCCCCHCRCCHHRHTRC
jgi:hypothetical protein